MATIYTVPRRPRTLRSLTGAAAALAIGTAIGTAHAQRTAENVISQSEDAFGRIVGSERLGIYSQDEVRGFSPIDAGNVRFEGLYFDQQTSPSSRLIDGSTIRVGIAAQSYPFPSPTGIVDYDIRRAGDTALVSPVVSYGPFDGFGLEIDAQLPLLKDRLGVAFGAEYFKNGFQWGGFNHSASFAVMPRWRPSAAIEILPFYSHVSFGSEPPQQLLFTSDGAPPPKFQRQHYFGQRWAQSGGTTSTYGLIGQAALGKWAVRLGVFDSSFLPSEQYADLYKDIDARGGANELVVASPSARFASRSGELRISRSIEAGTWRHTFHLATRARLQQRRYGGDVLVDVGEVQLALGRQIPEPQLNFGPQTRERVRQSTLGIDYELHWKNRGIISAGVQKTRYSKEVTAPSFTLPASRAHPLLPNAAGSLSLTPALAAYASYTEGLEESPIAPSNAINRNAAAPALRTWQLDGGVRWLLSHDLKLIAGLFDVKKPYFDLDQAQLFRQLGNVEHRGFEISLSGQPLHNLTVVAGTRYLDATVSSATTQVGELGDRPVGSFRWHAIGSADYALPGTRLSVDLAFESVSGQTANIANTVEVAPRAVVHIGGRYRFEMLGKPATLRVQVANIFDAYGWNVISGSAYTYNAPRRVALYLATDL